MHKSIRLLDGSAHGVCEYGPQHSISPLANFHTYYDTHMLKVVLTQKAVLPAIYSNSTSLGNTENVFSHLLTDLVTVIPVAYYEF